ncbi:MAG: TonB-dependent receptor [Bacteroidaceae bacterium]|nr:TonB-dependent receptor [Bacteroidaceae bacterium]
MMKQVKIRIPLRVLTLICGVFLSLGAFAQITVQGHVKDDTGEPLPGASVKIVGTQNGTMTDFNGNFELQAPRGAQLVISFMGFASQTVTAAPRLNITMTEDAKVLEDIVVIGYGTAKKTDLTGSVVALKPDMKNKGVVVTPQEMLQGKVAGVSITDGGGAPGTGSNIRIRGGSSLHASNDPLIVIDGLAMDNNGVKGLSNLLSMVNPQDIESFNVLKDASATAIYGSRGSNGVIIITTKKGRKSMKTQVSYNGNVTMSMRRKSIDVMDGDQFRSFITNTFGAGSDAVNALGTANTDWQKEIYRTAISHDHNVSVQGAAGFLPYRVSAGFTDQQGILRTSDFKRVTGSINLNPSFLDDHLTVNLTAKAMYAKTNYADQGAVSAAVWMDPSQDIYDTQSADAANFNNYYQWRTEGSALNDPTWPSTWYNLSTANPLSLLTERDEYAKSRSFVGNAEVVYKLHGFEDLSAHVNVGGDFSYGKQYTNNLPSYPSSIYYGSWGWEEITKRNKQLNAYLQFNHQFNEMHHLDLMAGYEWQHFWRELKNNFWGMYPQTNTLSPGQKYNETEKVYKTENYLVSFFGRLNYTLMDRYLFTATLRNDGSSRFKDHWSLFPSFAFAWKLKEEPLLRDLDHLSDAKLRLSYGVTGQQEGIGDYNYFAVYSANQGSSTYYPLLGNGTLYRPAAYDPDLKWESTTTYNIGLDLSYFKNRLTLSLDGYIRNTTDLLNSAYVAAGSNFANTVMTNIGSLRNYGFEFSVDWKAIQTKDWFWTLAFNATYNKNEITEISANEDGSPVMTGRISSGTNNDVQAFAEGYPAYTYYVYQQVYDENGLPIEGVYVDRNGDGQISQDDRYFYKSAMAPWMLGFSSRLEYKNWDFGFNLRASIGNYVFNDQEAGASNVSKAALWNNYLTNRPKNVLEKSWQTYSYVTSDYFVQNGSFLKCDNITLGYSFDKLLKTQSFNGLNGRVYVTANNVFCITKYKGIDPEVFRGIDNNMYPRPFSVQLGLNLNL